MKLNETERKQVELTFKEACAAQYKVDNCIKLLGNILGKDIETLEIITEVVSNLYEDDSVENLLGVLESERLENV